MDDQLKSNLTSSEHWARFFYMLVLGFFLYFATLIAVAVVVIQFFFALFTGTPNVRLKRFGWEIGEYIHQIWSFLTYNSEEKAFPFVDWPVFPEAPQAVETPETATAPPLDTVVPDEAISEVDSDLAPSEQEAEPNTQASEGAEFVDAEVPADEEASSEVSKPGAEAKDASDDEIERSTS